MCPKNAVHARIASLYRLSEYVKPNISSIRSQDQGHFIQVRGAAPECGCLGRYCAAFPAANCPPILSCCGCAPR
jgi:hypothetical protein